MEKFIIYVVSPDIPIDTLLSELHMDKKKKKESLLAIITEMHREAMKIARPVALYAAFVPEIKDGNVCINGISLEEKFVYEKLASCDVVIPYVTSCGVELEEWSDSFTDMFKQFVADTIKEMCRRRIREKLFREVQEKYFDADKSISTINPGSLEQWPIQGQKPLFAMLGGVTDDIGVVLSDSMMMIPTKSVSGIIFQTDEPYHNCQLCPKLDCPGREAPYEED